MGYLLLILLLLSFPAAPVEPGDTSGNISISTLAEIEQDVRAVPCKDDERLEGVKKLFEKMGARSEDISIQKFKDIENLVIEKQGKLDETIVLGAHYDKTKDGCGAIDNWTGIVMLAHLYRSFKDTALKKRLVFVAFGKEEKGLLGSKAMVKEIGKDKLDQYCAMINLDSFGMGMAQVATNISSPKLTDRAASIAEKMKIPFARGAIAGDSDSSSFRAKRIPALTIHGLADGFEKIIHTSKDKAENVQAGSVYLGYRLALALASELDNDACDASR